MLSRLVEERVRSTEAGSVYSTAPPPLSSSLAIHRIHQDLERLGDVVPQSNGGKAEEMNFRPVVYSLREGSSPLPAGTLFEIDPRNPYELSVFFSIPSNGLGDTQDLWWWGGQTLQFRISFTERYPYDGPRVRFIGPHRLFHPNVECGVVPKVSSVGISSSNIGPRGESSQKQEDEVAQRNGGWGVCLGVQMAWRPTFTLLDLLLSLWLLLLHPNADDPLPGYCQMASKLWVNNIEGYRNTAKSWINGEYIVNQ